MDGLEVEQSGQAGSDTGENEEKPGVTADIFDLRDMLAEQHDAPGQYQDYRGADGGGQVRVDILDAHLGKDGRQCRKKGGKKCIKSLHIELNHVLKFLLAGHQFFGVGANRQNLYTLGAGGFNHFQHKLPGDAFALIGLTDARVSDNPSIV